MLKIQWRVVSIEELCSPDGVCFNVRLRPSYDPYLTGSDPATVNGKVWGGFRSIKGDMLLTGINPEIGRSLVVGQEYMAELSEV